ncbi:hypothetical protein ENINMM260B_17095 [Enterobacter intestinihominis]
MPRRVVSKSMPIACWKWVSEKSAAMLILSKNASSTQASSDNGMAQRTAFSGVRVPSPLASTGAVFVSSVVISPPTGAG